MEYYSKEECLRLRRQLISPSLSLHYSAYHPIKVIRGDGVYFYDEKGVALIDCINNVALVGHSHPRLVKVMRQQMEMPSMALSEDHAIASEELTQKYTEKLFPTFNTDELNFILFARSGSEACELAVTLARAASGHSKMITLDGAYHGHTTEMMGLSTYKERQAKPGTYKMSPNVIVAPKPDVFQGQYKDISTAGQLYADDIRTLIKKAHSQGQTVAGFMSEPFMGTAGQVPLPPKYLSQVYKYVREAGGLCIADEVQTGFGRAGEHFWMHQYHDVVPDIVVIGKPMANGHPISAVVTRADIVAKFVQKYGKASINKYVTDPVSLALADTVLDIIHDEGLQRNAKIMGNYVVSEVRKLKEKHSKIGDVRGAGLFIGIEIVTDRHNLPTSDAAAAKELVKKALLDYGVMLKEDGTDNNVIKIKPPLCFNKDNADTVVRAIDLCLTQISS